MSPRAVKARPENLPAPVTSFVGRRAISHQIRTKLAETRLLTLTGGGGVGKSRLALHVAAQMQRAFPDGVWFVDLTAIQKGELVAHVLAQSIGMHKHARGRLIDALLEYLTRKRMLIILDNCEHVVDDCALLVGRLLAQAPDVRILATSRHTLGAAGEYVLVIPPLQYSEPAGALDTAIRSEAVRLFADRAVAVLPDFAVTQDNFGVVAEICRRLEGIPLAIELAAVRLRALSADDLLGQLTNRFHVLTVGRRNASGRHQTLSATFDWSYELCSSAEQVLWAKASVFADGFDLDAIRHVCFEDGVDVSQVLETVSGLVDKSIVVRLEGRGKTRYGFLETVRQYGMNRLAESGAEMEIRSRHYRWYHELATGIAADWFGPRQTQFLATLRQAHSNLRAAVEFEQLYGAAEEFVPTMAARLSSYWLASGLLSEGQHWLDEALRSPLCTGLARAHSLWVNACLASQQGDHEAARPHLSELGELASRLDDPVVLAHWHQVHGMSHLYAGRMPEAIAQLTLSMNEYLDTDQTYPAWITSYQIALTATTSAADDAASLCQDNLRMSRSRQAGWCEAYSNWLVGYDCWRRGDRDGADGSLRASLTSMLELEDPWGIASNLEMRAWLLVSDGYAERGARMLGAAHTEWSAMGARVEQIAFLAGPHADCVARLRRESGEAKFEAQFAAGSRLPRRDAAQLADLGRVVPAKAELRPANRPIDLLTRRERQVVELLAAGMTNRQIATQLVVAPRTAEAHVEHILAKLGLTSRAQVAAWMLSWSDSSTDAG